MYITTLPRGRRLSRPGRCRAPPPSRPRRTQEGCGRCAESSSSRGVPLAEYRLRSLGGRTPSTMSVGRADPHGFRTEWIRRDGLPRTRIQNPGPSAPRPPGGVQEARPARGRGSAPRTAHRSWGVGRAPGERGAPGSAPRRLSEALSRCLSRRRGWPPRRSGGTGPGCRRSCW